MTPQQALSRAFEIMGGKRAMAEALKGAGYHKITNQAVSAWRVLPRKWVIPVEAVVAAKHAQPVPTRHDFRPDIFEPPTS